MAPTGRTYAGVAVVQRKRDRRDRLLAAGLDRFTAVGFQQTKITELCAAAGVSTRDFYEVFPGKEALLLALHEKINLLALNRVDETLKSLSATDVRVRIGALVDVFVEVVASDPRLSRLNYVEAVGVSAKMERQHQHWVTRWSELIEQEAVRAATHGLAPERDYRLTAISLVGAVTGLLHEWQSHTTRYRIADVTAEIKSLMLAAITRHP
ncbi:MAG: TetR/AcrR family transcriptional regulator [Actinomycetota bacterium]|nr:TetR/AcrR family transcriptional regulator [Actinomycetota bacterium]